MLRNFKQILFSNWHPMRWLALFVGLFFAMAWLLYNEPFAGLVSLFFLFQAVTNTGCLAGQCAVPTSPIDEAKDDHDDIQYKEIN
ncbi:MAG: hypothetical protein WD267_01505 [Balneolales bacterium]